MDPNVQAAEQLISSQKYPEACAEYEKAAVMRAVDYSNWGYALAQQKLDDQAIQKYRKATETDARYAQGFYNLGNALSRVAEKLDSNSQAYRQAKLEAVEKLQRATELNPRDAQAFYTLGRALRRLKRDDEAIGKLDKAVQLKPDYHEAWNEWGNALYFSGDYKGAVAKFEKAAGAQQDPIYFRNWGLALSALDRRDEAIEKYTKATALNPAYDLAWSELGQELYARKDYQAAAEKFEKAAAIQQDASYYNFWGLSLLGMSRFEDAVQQLSHAIDLDPRSVNYLTWVKALEKVTSTRRNSAIAAARASITRVDKPEFIEGFGYWGNALAICLRFEESDAIFSEATRIISTQPSVYSDQLPVLSNLYAYWGTSYFNRGLFSDAARRYEQSVELKPDNPLPLLNWGQALFSQRRYSEAVSKLQSARNASSQKESVTNVCVAWGNVLLAQGLREDGLQKYREALAADPDCLDALIAIAKAHWDEGKYQDARKEWDAAKAAFERLMPNYRRDENTAFFDAYGAILHQTAELAPATKKLEWELSEGKFLTELDRAEEVFKAGLEIDPAHGGILLGLVRLCLGRKAVCSADRRGFEHWKARDYYARGVRAWTDRIVRVQDADSYLKLGQLHLLMENYGAAEKNLRLALQKDPDLPDVHFQLGTLYSRTGDSKSAITSFQRALDLDANPNFDARAGLAKASLDYAQPSRAVQEYETVLGVAPGHIVSILGLADSYATLGENGDEPLIEKALQYYDRAIEKGRQTDASSKLLSRPELAAAYYARGRTHVLLFNASKDSSHLQKALRDFKNCGELDTAHVETRIAKERLDKRIREAQPGSFWERAGPILVIFASIAAFVFAQVKFYFGRLGSSKLEQASYVTITLASIALTAAGAFLSKLSKLEVAGVKLEKSAASETVTAVALDIPKPPSPPSAGSLTISAGAASAPDRA
ncbi:MAG: tetratricopeptide repeat protein [Bryobacterales bacterium]|nr:tetratricopeptide repeat protein [Bryobacterales bacterium]MBV9399543.1 tetratricopeptide repeat protein [Bryobacterales bacterium]